MENAADALKMAAAVLVFVIALSISINAFGQARKTAQTILEYKDREFDYTYINEEEGASKTKRIVSGETIIPSIYKAYKENYKIVFKFNDGNNYLYKKKKNDGTTEDINSIDLANESIASDEAKEKYLEVLIFGENVFENNIDKKNTFLKQYQIESLNSKSIYDRIKGNSTFTESIGVYYQEEISGESGSPDANKTKKRVITYEEN